MGLGPFDTPASSTTRFLVELTAWVAGPWAAGTVTGSGWAALVSLGVLLVLPSIFNVPGDKNVTGVVVPGPVRLLIEGFLSAVAVSAAWYVWPVWAALLATAVAAAMMFTNMPRYRWLLAGASLT